MDKEVDIKEFSIKRTLSNIPEPEACPCCGGPTHKAFIPFSIQGRGSSIVNNEAPGYECRSLNCGAGLYDPQTTTELLLGAASLSDKLDTPLRTRLLKEALRIQGTL